MGNFIEEIIEKDLQSGKTESVVTRFPPEPNGYLHIGHAKSICLNIGMAKKFGGKCNLRFDDTNPAKEDEEYVNSIIADCKWLGWKGDIYFASDYFDVMYNAAVTLIKNGKAYIDDLTADQMREMRGTLTSGGTLSANRERPIAENLQLFQDMKNGLIADGALVLRAKIDMASPNINMRDPIIYRVLKQSHHRQGDKWCIYPMYDFAHPIEDAVEGISHSICTLEFEDHRPLYDWVLVNAEFKNPPHQYEFARLNIDRTIMSKRYLKKLVDSGDVEGWDDPRMPTIVGLKRRGYTASALAEFCERIGVSKANSQVETGQLESCIREELNMCAERAMAVIEPLELVITNRPNDYSEELEFEINPNQPERGTRKITIGKKIFIEKEDFKVVPPPKYYRLTVGGMVRLKGGYIIKCTGYEGSTDSPTKVFAEIVDGTRSGSDNSGIKVKGVIHWVNASDCANITFRLYDYLLIEGNADLDFSARLNPSSLVVRMGVGESILASAEPLKSYQFMRQGYFTRDSKIKEVTYNRIVGLKDSFTVKK